MAMIPAVIISVEKVPELLWAMRRELASVVREVAEAEPSPMVARRLREVATIFETGQLEDL